MTASQHPNHLRRLLESGSPAYGTASALPSALAIEQVASAGFDYVFIDMQHGLSTFSDLPSLCMMAQKFATTPLVRVLFNDFSGAQRALDAGAEGIIFPLIDSAQSARQAVDACRYPPAGNRSFGPYWSPYGADCAWANSQVLCFAMIESIAGLERLDEILTTPGLDGVYVGPNDLSISMGEGPVMASLYTSTSPKTASINPALQKALENIVAACKRHNKHTGLQVATGGAAASAALAGFAFVGIGGDTSFMATGAGLELLAAKRGIV